MLKTSGTQYSFEIEYSEGNIKRKCCKVQNIEAKQPNNTWAYRGFSSGGGDILEIKY